MAERGAASLFTRHVIVEEVTPLPDHVSLMEAEEQLVVNARPKRRREFAAGRYCARRALARLGIDRFALTSDLDRAPRWPGSVVGSISHTDRYCVAAVAPRTALTALGIDVEPDEPLESDLWPTVCVPDELRWLDLQPEQVRGRLARLIFSAKECTYKCLYPLARVMLDFHDVQIGLDLKREKFVATLAPAAGAAFPAGQVIVGTFQMSAGMIHTGMELQASR